MREDQQGHCKRKRKSNSKCLTICVALFSRSVHSTSHIKGSISHRELWCKHRLQEDWREDSPVWIYGKGGGLVSRSTTWGCCWIQKCEAQRVQRVPVFIIVSKFAKDLLNGLKPILTGLNSVITPFEVNGCFTTIQIGRRACASSNLVK